MNRKSTESSNPSTEPEKSVDPNKFDLHAINATKHGAAVMNAVVVQDYY